MANEIWLGKSQENKRLMLLLLSLISVATRITLTTLAASIMRKILPVLVLLLSFTQAQAQTVDCNAPDSETYNSLIQSGTCVDVVRSVDGSPIDTTSGYLQQAPVSKPNPNFDPSQPDSWMNPETYTTVQTFWVDNDGTRIQTDRGTGVVSQTVLNGDYPEGGIALTPVSWDCPPGTIPGGAVNYCMVLASGDPTAFPNVSDQNTNGALTYCEAYVGLCNWDVATAVPTSGGAVTYLSTHPDAAPTSGTRGGSVTYLTAGTGLAAVLKGAGVSDTFLDTRTAGFIGFGLLLAVAVVFYNGRRIVVFMTGVDTASSEYKSGYSAGKSAKNRRAGYRAGINSSKRIKK